VTFVLCNIDHIGAENIERQKVGTSKEGKLSIPLFVTVLECLQSITLCAPAKLIGCRLDFRFADEAG
jgi:hypothetical protein